MRLGQLRNKIFYVRASQFTSVSLYAVTFSTERACGNQIIKLMPKFLAEFGVAEKRCSGRPAENAHKRRQCSLFWNPINREFASSSFKINHNMQMAIDCVIERQKCRRRRRRFTIEGIVRIQNESNQIFIAVRSYSLASFGHVSPVHSIETRTPQLARRFPKTCDPGHKYFMMKWRNGIWDAETKTSSHSSHSTLSCLVCVRIAPCPIQVAEYIFRFSVCAIYCLRFFRCFYSIFFSRLIFSCTFFLAGRQRSTRNNEWNRWRAINHCHRKRTTDFSASDQRRMQRARDAEPR